MSHQPTQPDRSPGPRDAAEQEKHEHPPARTYWLIAFILTVLTGMEVAAFYIPALDPVLVPLLLVLTSAKFVLVVMFYMHLKADSKLFTWVFVAPLVLAMFMVIALVVLFKLLPLYTT